MTVPNASNKSGPYVLDGVATVFARTFLIVDADHLAIIRTENGVKTEITTGFIIDGVGNFTGNVTISPALTGGTVTLLRRVPNSQETDYSNQAKVAPAQVENDFDLVVMQIQDLAGKIEGIDTDAVILAEIQAEAAADAAQAWAESPTPPDPLDPTSKSSKTWAGEAAASAALVDLGALDDAVAATAADAAAADAARVLAETARDAVTGAFSPPGLVGMFAMGTAPIGWLAANGALVSRTSYAALFAAIGTRFGAGNGTTTFALPDLRGEFIRGWDNGRGVDGGRGLGSLQLDAFQNFTAGFSSRTVSNPVGAFSAAGSGQNPPGSGGNASYVSDFTLNPSTVARTAAETRPRNVALLACIKY